MAWVSREEFEQLVTDAIDSLPPDLARLIDNVAVFVEDDPPPGQSLLGLYEGVPLTRRGFSSYTMALPDRITIYRHPTLAISATEYEVRKQVRKTVVHEIAHHFGIADSRLHELGYG
jgi:predicted Zn-dependent protease with MMP-like domain